jgi:protein-tyrosine phosphatase
MLGVTLAEPSHRLLFVCLGNICRSPTGEAVMRQVVAAEGLAERFTIDSAGTGGWHVGESPDPRSVAAGRSRGIEIGGSARQVTGDDFYEFDLLLAADRHNYRDLAEIAPTDELEAKVRMLRAFDPLTTADDLDVPDPYYGGPNGFDEVIDLVEAACRGLLTEILAGRV